MDDYEILKIMFTDEGALGEYPEDGISNEDRVLRSMP